MSKTDREAMFEMLRALPLVDRVRAAIALVDEPRPSFRSLLEPVLETIARDLGGNQTSTKADNQNLR